MRQIPFFTGVPYFEKGTPAPTVSGLHCLGSTAPNKSRGPGEGGLEAAEQLHPNSNPLPRARLLARPPFPPCPDPLLLVQEWCDGASVQRCWADTAASIGPTARALTWGASLCSHHSVRDIGPTQPH